MSEYEKLTVVKLREELVKRGLPKTGLKAVLVQRLVESDSQSHANEPVTHSGTLNGQEGVDDVEGAAPSTIPEDQRGRTPEDSALNSFEPEKTSQQHINSAPDNDAISDIPAADSQLPENAPEKTAVSKLPQDDASATPSRSTPRPNVAQASEPAQGLSQETQMTSIQETPPDSTQPMADTTSQDLPPLSTQTSGIALEELKEDRNKRKRRSQSPPPSSVETAQKRAKADNGRPHVKLPEDDTSDSPAQQSPHITQDVDMNDGPREPFSEHPSVEKPINGEPALDSDKPSEEDSPTAHDVHAAKRSPSRSPELNRTYEKSSQEDEDLARPSTVAQKASPSDTRFRNLFSGPIKRDSSPSRPLPLAANDDHEVAPALHPATSALYIRDFMRPLNPGNLKEYLITLASPPGTDTNSDTTIITQFFIDTIRTHCLVGFANTSAASRVRSSLHERKWPDETNRKPLWVDFVPEEKLQKWIDVESEAAGDRRQGMKKWEVIYEEEDGDVTAYLQEAGPNSAPPKTVQPRQNSGVGPQDIASQSKDVDGRTRKADPAPKTDDGKGFRALDDLFLYTAAKPKLYYLPVPRDVVDRRLDRLAAGRGGGRGDEMRRYSFEETILVDKGPEFGARGRGGYGARGGAYSSRGGGYRGDTWRGRR